MTLFWRSRLRDMFQCVLIVAAAGAILWYVARVTGNDSYLSVGINSIRHSLGYASTPSPVPTKNPAFYVSLDNGTVLSKADAYFSGEGKLTIINNDSEDAVVKLVDVSAKKSVISLYVSSKSTTVTDNISDGTYKLFSAQGSDWDATKKAFAVDPSYQVFTDALDYTTDSSGSTTFDITFNPIGRGNAKTNDVPSTEFAAY